MRRMKVATGTVVDGKVIVESESVIEGATITVLLPESGKGFELSTEDENEILQSIAFIERGNFVSGEQLLEQLRRFG